MEIRNLPGSRQISEKSVTYRICITNRVRFPVKRAVNHRNAAEKRRFVNILKICENHIDDENAETEIEWRKPKLIKSNIK